MIRKNMIGLFTLAIFASMQLFAPAKAAAQDHWVASDAVGYNHDGNHSDRQRADDLGQYARSIARRSTFTRVGMGVYF